MNRFLKKHVDVGIKLLGASEGDIIRKIANVIVRVDQEGLLKYQLNEILACINNQFVTICCFIDTGSVRMLDAFIGGSQRTLEQTIDWRLWTSKN